ncbi:MAG: hypothetical protein H0U40_06225 [Chloroflexia bacterium]|nr:hypothetical protein [Chloroflexia bacterium]MDQ3514822.1 hypothetical protein [Chloroflexota bacterium]
METPRHGFCHGADMDPERVRQRWPGARFVARARIVTGGVGDLGDEAAAGDEVGLDRAWGILLAVAADEDMAGGEPVRVRTDDGRSFGATVLTTGDDLADPVETIRWARYWELSPAYVVALATAHGQPGVIEEG